MERIVVARLGRGALLGAVMLAFACVAVGVAVPASATQSGTQTLHPSAAAIDTCLKVAAKAGFSYTGTVNTSHGPVRQIVVAVAVAMAESSCNPNAVYTNSNGCRDRGLWQIDDCAHPDVSNACAFQAQCNADGAWRISNHGSNWTAWSTYNHGDWATYLDTARGAVSGFTVMLTNPGTGTCLDADASDVRNGGKIFQWTCSAGDSHQQWRVMAVNGYNPVLQNVGTGTCLDADASDVRNGGKIFQWACSTTGDAYQRWWFRGSGQLNTNGDANAGLVNAGAGTCLDADATDVRNGGKIFQWACNGSDHYQWWN